MTNPKRLVFVSGSYPDIICGTSGHIRLVAQRTAALGDFEVVVLTSKDPRVDVSQARGYLVCPDIPSWHPAKAGAMVRQILDLQPDIVHIQNPTIKYRGWRSITMSLVAPLIKRKAPQIRVVVMQHDLAVSKPLWRRRYYPLLKSCDAICISNSRDEQALLAQGVAPQKIYRTPVGPHMKFSLRTNEDYQKARQRLGILPSTWVMAHFGFVQPSRHVDILLRAISELRKKHDVYGLILGGPAQGEENYYRHCQNLTKKLGLESHVHWTGFATSEQIAEGLAASDIFVCLNQRGADLRNTSIMTAMMVGVPVITTKNPRYYSDQDIESTGCLLVPPGDVNILIENMLQLINSPPSPEFLAHNAKRFDPERIWPMHIAMNVKAYLGLPNNGYFADETQDVGTRRITLSQV